MAKRRDLPLSNDAERQADIHGWPGVRGGCAFLLCFARGKKEQKGRARSQPMQRIRELTNSRVNESTKM